MSSAKPKTPAKKVAAAPVKAVSVKTPTKKASKKVVEEEVPEEKKRKRREVNKETVHDSAVEYEARIEAEIQRIRDDPDKKSKGIKFLRSILKNFRTIHADTNRVTKYKKKNPDGTKKSGASGFLKPAHISQELADFAGFDANKLYSRVDVTNVLCKYIKDNKLPNPKDGREIFCNDELAKLLRWDKDNIQNDEEGKPIHMNYYRLQQHIKVHFTKAEDENADKKIAAKKAASKKGAAKKSTKKVVKDEEEEEEEEEEVPKKKATKAAPKKATPPVKKSPKKAAVKEEEEEEDDASTVADE